MQYRAEVPRIKNIQYGYVRHVAGSGTSQTINFSTGGLTAVDPTKTIMFYQWQTLGNNIDSSYTSFRLASTNTFNSQIGYDYWDIYYYVTLVEFYDGINVQNFYVSAPGSSTTDYTINEVDLNKTFIVGGSYYVATPVTKTWPSTAGAYWYLLNNSTLRYVPKGTNTHAFACQIVSLDGARVQQIVSTVASGNQSQDYTILPVNTGKAFMTSCTSPQGVLNTEFPVYNLSSSTTINASRYSSTPSGVFPFAAWVVEAPQIYTQPITVSIADSGYYQTINLVSGYLGDFRRFIVGTTDNSMGRVNVEDYDNYPNEKALFIEPSGINIINANRLFPDGNLTAYATAIDWIEEPIIRRKEVYTQTITTTSSGAFIPVTDFVPSKSIVYLGLAPSGNQPSDYLIAPQVTSSGIWIHRGSGTVTSTGYVNLIEFSAGVFVEHGNSTVNFSGIYESGFYATTKTDWIDGKTFCLSHSRLSATSNNLGNDNIQHAWPSPTGVWIFCQSPGTNRVNYWQMVQMDKAIVQKIPPSTQTTATTWNDTITSVDTTKSFVIAGMYTNNSTMSGKNIPTARLANSTTLTWDKIGTTNTGYYMAQVVSVDSPSVYVQRGYDSLPTGVLSVTTALSPLVNSGTAINWLVGALNQHSINVNENDDRGDEIFGYSTLSNSGITVSRKRTSQSGNLSWEVINFDNYNYVSSGNKRYRGAKLNITGGSGVTLAGGQAGFPLLLRYKNSSGNLPLELVITSGAYPSQYDGGDIIVSTDSSGTNRLPLEIVHFYKGNDISEALIEMYTAYPNLTGAGQSLFIFWHPDSNSGQLPISGWIYQPSHYNQYGTYNTWRQCQYSGVWHFSDNDCSGIGTFFDSAGFGGSGSIFGSPANYKTSGWLGFAVECGSNMRVAFEDSVNETYAGTQGFTAEMLAMVNETPVAWDRWIEKGCPPPAGNGYQKWGLMYNNFPGSGFRFEKYNGTTQDLIDITLPSSIGSNVNDWMWLGGCWSKTNSRMDAVVANLTRGGVFASGANTSLAANALTKESGDLWLTYNEKTATSHPNLRVDEARFGAERGPNWLNLQARQHTDPNFVEVYQIYNPQDGYSDFFSLPFTDNFDDGIIDSRWLYFENDSTRGTWVRESGGVIAFNTGGTDIWQGNNQYNTLYCTRVSGDFTAIVKVIACPNVGSLWAKAGLIVKNDITFPNTSPGYCIMVATPSINGWQWGVDNNTISGQLYAATNSGTATFPCWVKIQKQGTNLSGFFSTDGSNYTRMGTNGVSGVNIVQDVGIVSCSQVTGTTGIYIFDDFSITGPTGSGVTAGFQYIQAVKYGEYYGEHYGNSSI